MARQGDAIRFGFATGRVMVLRTRLLGPGTFERLLDAPSLDDQKRVLSETHYGRFIDAVKTAGDVERAVDLSLGDLYTQFLERSGLPPAVIGYFRTPYDFQVLKARLKARVLGGAPGMPPVFLGSLRPEEFEVVEMMQGALGDAVTTVLDADPPLDAEQIDAVLDRAMFEELGRLARSSNIDLLEELALRETDVANAKVLLRCAIAKRGADVARRMLVGRGRWAAERALDLVTRPEELAEAVAVSRVLPAKRVSDLLDLTRLDVLAGAAVARLAREAAQMPVGPEPVLGYVLSRRAEAASVRAVLVGRLSGLPRDVIAGRLGEVAS